MSAVLASATEMVPMQDGDLAAVLAIENDIYAFPWTAGNFRDALMAGYSGWICRRSDEIVGYAILMLAVDEGHLLNLGIATRHQHQGYGARLLRFIMDVARRGGATSLLLEVRPSNRQAIELYRHFGFAQIGMRRGYYPATAGREDAIVLRRTLQELSA